MSEVVARLNRVFKVPQVWPTGKARQAAVLVAMTEANDSQILLTRRSKKLRHHPGEVALPGGMWEASDRHLVDTALREAHEEVALMPGDVKVAGAMALRSTRQGTQVMPVISSIPEGLSLQPCQRELESLFYLPVSYLLEDPVVQYDVFEVGGQIYKIPVYSFDGYRIWGFTALLLVDVLSELFSTRLGIKSAPEEIFKSNY